MRDAEDRYSVVLRWSVGDQAWIATVPALPGCIADGPTRFTALLAARNAIAVWLATAADLGREIPAEDTR